MLLDLFSTEQLALTNPYIQLYKVQTNQLFNFNLGELADADTGTYAHLVLEPHADDGRTNAGAFVFTFPSAIPEGVYTMILKDGSSPSDSDDVKDFERINIRKTPSGSIYLGNASRIFRSR